MKSIKACVARRLILSFTLLFSVGGCAVYPAPPTYSYFDSDGQTVYASPVVPAPVYVSPGYVAPAYFGPPVFFNFGFGGYWGGRGYRRGGGHWHGRGR